MGNSEIDIWGEISKALFAEPKQFLAENRDHSELIETKNLFSMWAPPLFWGEYMVIFTSFGPRVSNAEQHVIIKDISYQSISQAKSPFDIEIEGADRFISDIGPGASRAMITGNVATSLRIRARSHALGQNIRVRVI